MRSLLIRCTRLHVAFSIFLTRRQVMSLPFYLPNTNQLSVCRIFRPLLTSSLFGSLHSTVDFHSAKDVAKRSVKVDSASASVSSSSSTKQSDCNAARCGQHLSKLFCSITSFRRRFVCLGRLGERLLPRLGLNFQDCLSFSLNAHFILWTVCAPFRGSLSNEKTLK